MVYLRGVMGYSNNVIMKLKTTFTGSDMHFRFPYVHLFD